jgi:geranylgeranyl pyrophosphate synthase
LIHVRKTGALILAALRIGAQVAKATSADLAWLSRYREYLGLAFQIVDDILDSHGGELSTAAEWSHKEPKQAIHRLLESS